LPRGLERELVRYRDREYTLRSSESRTLAISIRSGFWYVRARHFIWRFSRCGTSWQL
jgi:hypothetical protein